MTNKLIIVLISFLIATAAGAVLSTSASPALISSTSRQSLPIYGQWCGPFHSGASRNSPCDDALDCACKRHDICYGDHGYINCKCDNDLVIAVRGMDGATAKAIALFFDSSVCNGPRTIHVPAICESCRTVLGRKICVPHPCTKPKCSKVPVFLNKENIRAFDC